MLTPRRGDPRGDARRQTPAGLPRQLRAPPDPAEPVPERDVVCTVEVHGMFTFSAGHLAVRGNLCADWWLQDERHSYEKCQYVEFKKRVAKMDELRESKGGARSN